MVSYLFPLYHNNCIHFSFVLKAGVKRILVFLITVGHFGVLHMEYISLS